MAANLQSVTEQDFAIRGPSRVRAGTVDLRVHNLGPDEHELIVLRVGAGPPPLRADGLTINEEAVQRDEPGSLEPGQPGAKRNLTVTLTPGHYILFCNMAGHYLGGMHTNLVVTQ